MSNEKKKLGNISISYHAIATIAFQSALESYGVSGIGNREFRPRNLSSFFQGFKIRVS